MLATANLGVWDWNLATDQVQITPEYRRLLGYADTEPVCSTRAEWLEAVHPDDRRMLEHAAARLAAGTG